MVRVQPQPDQEGPPSGLCGKGQDLMKAFILRFEDFNQNNRISLKQFSDLN
jgi:hypothetical protein